MILIFLIIVSNASKHFNLKQLDFCIYYEIYCKFSIKNLDYDTRIIFLLFCAAMAYS